MTRSRSRWRSVTLLLVATALVGEACGGPTQPTASAQPSSLQPVTAAPSVGPFEPMAWPADDAAPCDQAQAPDVDHVAYAGLIRRIRAVDARTVEFELCAPDVAFPTRLAFAALGINDT
ncbi:MAG TPA: hypothetical protein VFW02_03165, partial [Candidatus Limnocylindrales bacterium]|nr:hypothetical protein [Candidatus Limnocylindrales bacterium]